MKVKLLLVPFILLCSFSITSCDKEDGNINDWVGVYRWGDNREEKWHRDSLGKKSRMSITHHYYDSAQYTFEIRKDRTWFQHNSDKIETSGYSGKVKCYKNYVCFTNMPSKYYISDKLDFKHDEDSQGMWIKHYKDESVDRHDLDFDYNIRNIYLKLIK